MRLSCSVSIKCAACSAVLCAVQHVVLASIICARCACVTSSPLTIACLLRRHPCAAEKLLEALRDGSVMVEDEELLGLASDRDAMMGVISGCHEGHAARIYKRVSRR